MKNLYGRRPPVYRTITKEPTECWICMQEIPTGIYIRDNREYHTYAYRALCEKCFGFINSKYGNSKCKAQFLTYSEITWKIHFDFA